MKINELRVTKDDLKKYIEQPFRCPRCGAEEIIYGRRDEEGFRSFQVITCNECLLRFIEVKEIVAVEVDSPMSEDLKRCVDPTIKCDFYCKTTDKKGVAP